VKQQRFDGGEVEEERPWVATGEKQKYSKDVSVRVKKHKICG
jgi:hypothetical protein